MTLFRDKLLTVQDEYLRESPSNVDPENDDDVDYSNDDLGENTEVTPLGDEIDDEDMEDVFQFPGEDDEFDDDEDLMLDDDELLIEEDEDEAVDVLSIDGDEDEDDFNEDDDLFNDDDDEDFDSFDESDVAPVSPEEDEDGWDDDDDDDLKDESTEHGSVTEGLNPNFEIHHPERRTGRMTDHEPGVSGFNE